MPRLTAGRCCIYHRYQLGLCPCPGSREKSQLTAEAPSQAVTFHYQAQAGDPTNGQLVAMANWNGLSRSLQAHGQVQALAGLAATADNLLTVPLQVAPPFNDPYMVEIWTSTPEVTQPFEVGVAVGYTAYDPEPATVEVRLTGRDRSGTEQTYTAEVTLPRGETDYFFTEVQGFKTGQVELAAEVVGVSVTDTNPDNNRVSTTVEVIRRQKFEGGGGLGSRLID